MQGLIIAALLALSLGISWWNCYAVGKSWVESKMVGGWVRVVAWSGAVMAAVGFTQVILVVLALIAGVSGALPPKALHQTLSLGYLLIIVPALGAGFILTIESWRAAWRERDLASVGGAAWNTFAQVHNTIGAIDTIGSALADVGDLFKGDSDDDEDSGVVLLVLLIAAAAVAGGVMITAALIKKYAGTVPLPQRTLARA